MGLLDKLGGYFASNTSIQATSATTPSNELENSIRDLSGRYRLGRTNAGNYIKFGTHDDFPAIIDKLGNMSPVHSGILTKKAKMVTGRDILYSDDFLKTNKAKAELKAFMKNCGGSNIGMYEVVTHAAFQYEKAGAFALHVRWSRDRSKIVELKSLDIKGVRAAEPNERGDVTHYLVRRTFGQGADSMPHNDVRKIPKFNKFDKKQSEAILYVANPFSGNPYYGVPTYISAFHYIASDFSFGKHIKNSAENGFSPKVMATMVGRNMSPEQKAKEYEAFRRNFSGSDGEQMLLAWVNKPEDVPHIKSLDVSNLDKTVDVLARLNDSKILTAHNVTSPTLFGIMVSGKLGGTGNELITAYQIFRATETLPNREMLINGFNRILETIGYDEMNMVVDEETINLENMKGGNTEDIKPTGPKQTEE